MIMYVLNGFFCKDLAPLLRSGAHKAVKAALTGSLSTGKKISRRKGVGMEEGGVKLCSD